MKTVLIAALMAFAVTTFDNTEKTDADICIMFVSKDVIKVGRVVHGVCKVER